MPVRSAVLRRLRGADGDRLRYRSLQDLSRDVASWTDRLPADIDVVVGIPRSGLLAASLLALQLHKPLVDLPTFLSGADPWHGLRLSSAEWSGSALLVDDSVNSGTEMARVLEAIRSSPTTSSRTVLLGAVYASPRGARHVDTYAELLPTPRAFEWNLLQNKYLLSRACMDIDGVLCPDPPAADNDDGRRYRTYINSSPLIYRPPYPVHTLVTSRLEKYRSATEAWLRGHGVEYGELVMLDLPTAADRRLRRAHVPHKAAAYLATDNLLFIESDAREARLIHELSERPVFVASTRDFLGSTAAAVSAVDRRAARIMSFRVRAGSPRP